MQYHDGTTAKLGDVVDVGVPAGTARARIVMLGDTYEHLDIDGDFLSWVTTERKLSPDQILVEWIEANPFAHNDPQYAPVGNYLFLSLDGCDKRVD
jgi:hypothetical protein